MSADVLPALGARAHCDCHSPGQRHNVESLVAWQARGGARFFGAAQERPLTASPRQALGEGDTGVGLDMPGLQRLAPAALAWQPPGERDDAGALGTMQLWAALPSDVEWLDLTLSVHRSGHWWRLHPDVLDEPGELGDYSGLPRMQVVLPAHEVQALAGLGISLAALQAAAAQPETACWCCRVDGLGAFVAGLVDLGWPQQQALP